MPDIQTTDRQLNLTDPNTVRARDCSIPHFRYQNARFDNFKEYLKKLVGHCMCVYTTVNMAVLYTVTSWRIMGCSTAV